MFGLILLYGGLAAWGYALGKMLAWAFLPHGEMTLRARANLWIARQLAISQGNLPRRFGVNAAIVTSIGVSYAAFLFVLVLVPEIILRYLLRIDREILASWTWLYAILGGTAIALARAVPQYRRWGAWYRKWNTVTCPRCTRVNDRPRFPGHHEYYFVFGYPAKMTGDRFSCRWCDAPLEFPDLDPRIREAPPGGWKIP
jgi:hypothetical protein